MLADDSLYIHKKGEKLSLKRDYPYFTEAQTFVKEWWFYEYRLM